MSRFNIVTNQKIVDLLRKKCKYFKVNLGFASSMEDKSGGRTLSDKDSFAHFYNSRYNAYIMGKGRIGDIMVYVDLLILEDKIAFYFDKEEYIFDLDEKMIIEKGVEFYLGHLIKIVEESQERAKAEKEKQTQNKKLMGDANKVINNPGNVNYDDIKAFIEKKRQGRMNLNK
jgi:hypothetical protein